MPIISREDLVRLQGYPDRIRNICLLAHVDHGKTTLADRLLATNGIISSKLAGKIRFLDSRPDEQERGITMKASAISLYFKIRKAESSINTDSKEEAVEKDFLINLVDSPGHVDFSSEVSIASRLSDGALILIDVVEGISSQTIVVFRQAWVERITPILVLNKIDRLITELRLSPSEAFVHINKIIEQANAVMASFSMDDYIVKQDESFEKEAGGSSGFSNDQHDSNAFVHEADSYFVPEEGNVIFASAIDGWSFRIKDFASILSQKMGFNENNLRKVLWGDFYFDPKAKKVITSKQLKGRSLKPMAVQFILENLWAVYEAVVLNNDPDRIKKIVQSLSLKISLPELKSKDFSVVLGGIMGRWIPLSRSVLLAILEYLPSPKKAQNYRLDRFLKLPELGDGNEESDEDEMVRVEEDIKEIKESIDSCDSSEDSVMVAFIAKMVSVKKSLITPLTMTVNATETPEEKKRRRDALISRKNALKSAYHSDASEPMIEVSEKLADIKLDSTENFLNEGDQEIIVGIGRIYSGKLRKDQTLNILHPKFDPRIPTAHCVINQKVKNLYLVMGKELQEVEEVPAGNIFAIGGLEKSILKFATISSSLSCPSFGSLHHLNVATPILRVAVEPEDPRDMEKFMKGLELLNQADPCVETILQDNGEHVILTAGELHLERCLLDLREKFSKVPIIHSPPIVPFREGIVGRMNSASQKILEGAAETFESSTSDGLITLKIKAYPLPQYWINFHENNNERIKNFSANGGKSIEEMNHFIDEASQLFEKYEDFDMAEMIRTRLWSLGPKLTGSNILLNGIEDYHRSPWLGFNKLKLDTETPHLAYWLDSSIVAGFQMASLAGPLCAEPMQGVCFVVNELKRNEVEPSNFSDNYLSSISGQMIPLVRESCRSSFLINSPRLLLAYYSCEIQANAEVLGRVYTVIGKRNGKIIEETAQGGGGSIFTIKASIPAIESFGLTEEIRKRTSGMAHPQLIFAGWQVLDEDPFWIPSTEEELEELGDKADKENKAKKYMHSVRLRKGMFVERKIVEHAEKQKTFKQK